MRVCWNPDSLRGLVFLDKDENIIAGEWEDFDEGSPLNIKEGTFKLKANQHFVGVKLRIAHGNFGYVAAISMKYATYD